MKFETLRAARLFKSETDGGWYDFDGLGEVWVGYERFRPITRLHVRK